MFTDDGQEILSNILYIQFANLISDNPIHTAEEVLDLEEFAPIRNFLEEHKGSAHKRVLRETITIENVSCVRRSPSIKAGRSFWLNV